MEFNDQDRARYSRNMLIPGLGEDGQKRLARARVLIVGLGGLGSPAAFYLAAAGVGTLGLLDADTVNVSNLQRQILHRTLDIGEAKVVSATRTLQALEPALNIEPRIETLTADNAADIVSRYDAVIEATDNFEAKFLLNDTCLGLGKPLATAGILALAGHAMFVVPGKTACLRCVVPHQPDGVPTTAELGVLGSVPGILGSLEALEVVRWLVGLWTPQDDCAGLLHSVDGNVMRLHTMRVAPRPQCACATLGRCDD